MVGVVIGSTLGAYVPLWFGADSLSIASVVGAFVGGLFGIWIMAKLFSS